MPQQHSPILERDSQPPRTSSRGNSVNSDTHQLSYPQLLDSASAAVSQTSPNSLISFAQDQTTSLSYSLASSSHITSPSNSSSSLPTEEPRNQAAGYHPRDETDDYLQISDSDTDLRAPKRLRTKEIIEEGSSMRIDQTENGTGSSTNGVAHTNGDVEAVTNGHAVTNTKLQKIRQQELVRLMVQSLQDMGYRSECDWSRINFAIFSFEFQIKFGSII